MPTGQKTQDQNWLIGGGEMGALIRAFDWSTTPLGPSSDWPQSLKTSVSLCLSSTFPILLAWGPEDIQIYNDAYRPICGPKHPEALGMPFKVCWATALPVVGGAFDRAHTGVGAYIKDQQMFLDRYGYLEEAFMTFSFGPIRVETGEVGGIFHPITETTEATLTARRTKALREISLAIATSKSVSEMFDRASEKQKSIEHDLPYFLFYELSNNGEVATLSKFGGTNDGCNLRVKAVELADQEVDTATWPLKLALEEPYEVQDVRARFGDCAVGPFNEPTTNAVIMPLKPAGATKPFGFLVAGVSSRRALDEEYQSFYSLLAASFTSVISNIRAYEEELKKAEALAEIDRAKTDFFSNVSHEFRTPLTLILGPLEDSLKDTVEPLMGRQRERQEVTHRNAVRLLKLVNSLLDFSRIEAGRLQANYVPTNLSKLTADLASVFRSATDRAGLELVIANSDVGDDVFVDPEMWEKIVLNLISNAFKFTFEGSIHISVTNAAPEVLGRDAVQLKVSDTGIGVAPDQVPRLFERFHRVQGAQGRSFEGSGIGLALVQELVRLHGGQIKAESELGKGTTFTVTLPRGSSHLPSNHIGTFEKSRSLSGLSSSYVNEAERWLPSQSKIEEASEYLASGERRPRLLLVDDNADMRDYVADLLRERYIVDTAADGLEALAKISLVEPDLVLSDVMMPRMDGFQLLAELRKRKGSLALPVIMLSARAGEEARLEGLDAGAEDYLVKPFSARELLSRVESVLTKSQIREEAHAVLKESEARFRSMFQNTSVNIALVDIEGNLLYVNDAFKDSIGYESHELIGLHFSHITHPDDVVANASELSKLINGTERTISFEKRYMKKQGGFNWVRTTISRYESEDQRLRYLIAISQDIGEAKKTEREAQTSREEAIQANQSKSAFLANMSHEIRTPLGVIKGFADLLAEIEMPTSDASVWAKTIRRNAEELTTIINDILDLSKVESGMMELEKINFRLQSLIEEVRTLVEFKAREKGVSVEFKVAPDVPEVIATDPTRLRQLLLNIVGNAVKFTGRGRVTVEISVGAAGGGSAGAGFAGAGAAGGSAGAGARKLICRVSDTGIGIQASHVSKLFQPFSQADNSVTRLFGGTGLGLAFSKKLAVALGGDLYLVSSEPGQGSVFEFSIATSEVNSTDSRNVSSHPAVANIITSLRPTLASPLAGVKILLVEDSLDNQALITRYLKAAGAMVSTANDGRQGIETASSESFDIVLMDIQMPELDGLSAMTELRNRGYKKPIVALTAHAMREERDRALSAGFDGYLTKPIDRKTLIETLASLSF